MAEVLITNMGRIEGKRYMISDAAKLVDVESHVLRYWEEELDIQIPRNEMGHRYYTDYYIQVFKKIKELKDQGFLLKAIKIALPEIMNGEYDFKSDYGRDYGKDFGKEYGHEIAKDYGQDSDKNSEREMLKGSEQEFDRNYLRGVTYNADYVKDKNAKLEQFQLMLGNVIGAALKENNKTLTSEMSKDVSDSVIKEMDYLLRLKEEREEERFKKFDEMVRGLQKDTKNSAIKKVEKKRKIFGKNRGMA